MMLDANVQIIFWPEAIRTACYLHGRSPTSSLADSRSPYEALYGTIPKIGHLRRFGCRAYKHIPPAQRTEKKFGNRSSMCMMLGYCWNCFSPLRCGAPTEATPQQRRRQKRCGEQRHSNGNGKGILATTAWYSYSSVRRILSSTLLHTSR